MSGVIARGATRECVRDARDPGACLKFELPPGERTPAGPRERLRRWLGRQIPRFGENATELRAWRRLRRQLGAEGLAGRIAACHGIVQTDRGPGLRCELVRLPDGAPAPSLHALLSGEASPLKRLPQGSGEACAEITADTLCAAVDDFAAWLQAHDIPLFDLNAGNFVVVPGLVGPRLVCVDAKSTVAGKELVPVSRWIRPLMHRKIARRAARLKSRIRAACQAQAPGKTPVPAGPGFGSLRSSDRSRGSAP